MAGTIFLADHPWLKCQESQNKYDFVSQSKLPGLNIKQIKGLIDVHSVVTLGIREIAVRNPSSFFHNCFDDREFSCGGWRVFTLSPTPEVATESIVGESIVGEPEATEDPLVQQNTHALNEKVQVGNDQEMEKSLLIFNSTSRYLDDLLNIDNRNFEGMVNQIYPPELQLNKANISDTETPFLD